MTGMIMFRNMGGRRVRMTGLRDLFPENKIELIKIFVEPHHCHSNAQQIARYFNCDYAEGVFIVGGVEYAHAFNCIDGRYFDATLELVAQETYQAAEFRVRRLFKRKNALKLFDTFHNYFISYRPSYCCGEFVFLRDDHWVERIPVGDFVSSLLQGRVSLEGLPKY